MYQQHNSHLKTQNNLNKVSLLFTMYNTIGRIDNEFKYNGLIKLRNYNLVNQFNHNIFIHLNNTVLITHSFLRQ